MEKLKDILPRVLRNRDPELFFDRSSVRKLWKDLVGEDLAAYTTPVDYGGPVLVVLCRHPAAAMEIRTCKENILAVLNTRWKRELFVDVRTVTGNEEG